ncbi:hypothetical protein J22TS3_00110 [Paenibacillus sp. J22TS3]|nr:hypothetical protein J22TS3_00110 [Paenibacillus sp. J22TS3]
MDLSWMILLWKKRFVLNSVALLISLQFIRIMLRSWAKQDITSPSDEEEKKQTTSLKGNIAA